MKNKIFYKGKCFDSLEEAEIYHKQWAEYILEKKTAKEIFDSLFNDIFLNVYARGTFTNGEFVDFVEKIFKFSIEQINLKQTREENVN